jgi:amino acid transporter
MELSTSRPRVLGWLRSAAFLDGDWGTSIAYVLGIAFFLAGYNSGWHLLMMLILTTMVALNYVTICRLYPSGGGVYSSVRHRSRNMAVIGALLLSADYVVTASLSVLEACHYFAFENPQAWAIGVILGIGMLNWFGPRHAGSLATVISLATLVSLLILMAASFPSASQHISLAPPSGSFLDNWRIFVGIILSISGIEAISNMTGVMKDPEKNSRRAILAVLSKIVLATIILGFAMLAIPEMDRSSHKEEMIRYLGEFYIGDWFGQIIGIVLGFLLVSAGNTAINALTSIQFLMAFDGDLPKPLQKLNKYGVPIVPLMIATAVPAAVLMVVHDVITLSHLYAIGVVGAILINIGSTGTDKSLNISLPTRIFMMFSALILFFVEATIAIEKTEALIFASGILVVGLTARAVAKQQFKPKEIIEAAPPPRPVMPKPKADAIPFTSKMLVAVRDRGERLLRQVCEEAKLRKSFLFILHINQVSVVGLLPEKLTSESYAHQEWIEKICSEYGIPFRVVSIFSSDIGYTIAEQAATMGVDRVVLGATQRSLVERALRGDVIQTVSQLLPEEIQLTIYRA